MSTKRPAPRQSKLTGNGFTKVDAPAPSEQSNSRPKGKDAATPAGKTAPKRRYPHKVSFYQDPESTARVRGAILYTPQEGPRTLSQFIDHAVMAEVERLETKYNHGDPFPPITARELPQGRPMGS